jgi:hypothetical protein
VTPADLETLAGQVRASRDAGVRWLLEHIAASGEPVGADERNGWSRVPWALAVAGESAVAARVVAWAERGQLTADGNFAAGPAFGEGRFGAYPLAHFAIGAWLTERIDVAIRTMNALRRWQDPATGGLPIAPPQTDASDIHDLLSTAQTGLAAVVTGQDDIADLAWRWVADLAAQQPDDAGSCFYTFRKGATLLTDPDKPLEWLAVTDFAKPRQTYYTAGMAAVFLAAYAGRRGTSEPIELARRLLRFNVEGCAEQCDDPDSVQVCKFGWGAAAMLAADPDGDWLPHVARMGEWFIRQQAVDGSWSVSRFMQPNPSDIDKLVKTAEHVMEVDAIYKALGTAQARI